VVKIGQTENNLPANELLVLLAHTSGLHAACMHRRYAPNIPTFSVGDLEERTGEDNRPTILACEIVNHSMQRG
jgi:hypothetical protein